MRAGLGLDAADFGDELTTRGILGDEAVGASGGGLFHKAAGTMLGEEDDFRLRQVMLDKAGGLEAADDGHGDIHEDEIGPELFSEVDGVATVGGLGNDLDVHVGLEEFDDGFSDDLAVVHDENAQRRPISLNFGRTDIQKHE